MARQAAEIITARRRFSRSLAPMAAARYRAISGRDTEDFRAEYQCCLP